MSIKKYRDGTSYVEEFDFLPTTTKRINNYEDLWHLNQYVEVCNSNGYTPTIIIPNLLEAQADRRFHPNQSSGLKLVCKLLNGMDANFKIFHPHNSEVVEALMDNVEIIDNEEFILSVLDELQVSNGEITLMSTDAGGFKPMMKLCDQLGWAGETYSASKARTDKGMVQLIDRLDFKGADILIIDDLSVTGGTFKGLASKLRARNCGKLYLAVSHMMIQDLGEDPVTNYFDEVFTTNSRFDCYHESDEGGCTEVDNLMIFKTF